MEERLRKVESDFLKLHTTIKNAIYGLGLFGALLASWLGYNSFVEIPNAIKRTVSSTEANSVLSTLNDMKDEAQIKMEEITKVRSEIGNLKAVTLYQCPEDWTTPDANWASYGCIGQINSVGNCRTTAYGHNPEVHKCTPITVYQKIQ